MPSQESTTDQLEQAVNLCNREGLYDAADWLRREILNQRVWLADCRRCRTEALDANPYTLGSGPMILCVHCGDKRCPHAQDHRDACPHQGAV